MQNHTVNEVGKMVIVQRVILCNASKWHTLQTGSNHHILLELVDLIVVTQAWAEKSQA